jgi:DNA repair photolyase
MIETKFWHPTTTSQFDVCCIPFHLDTYRGCTYGCKYCFARDFIQFARRNKGQKQSYLVGNKVKSFEKWIDRVLSSPISYEKSHEVAFKERMPLKIGATADPFPVCEKTERITYGILKALQKIDYPVQISTKNPEVFLEYAHEFVNSNLAFTVSVPFVNDDDARAIECGAISTTRRFEAIKKITDLGIPVLTRIHPTVYPYIIGNAEELVKKVKDSGCWGFMSEMLKIRVIMPQSEKGIYGAIGEHFGFDILKYFKENGVVHGGDREYSDASKQEVFDLFNMLSNKYDLKYYNADNLIKKEVGCGSECCGTAMLHDYKVWRGNKRTLAFDDCQDKATVHFQKCRCNFMRSQANINNTIEHVTNARIKARG